MSAVVRATRTQQRVTAIGIALSVCVISGLHYTVSTHAILVHEILRRLYYVPIVVAASRYGAQGGIATALLASALFLPHIVMSWSDWPVFEVGQYGEIILLNVIGAVTGIMADRLRAEGNRYRQASEALAAAYEQLKVSTDNRLKSERMATVGRVAAGMAHEIRTPLGGLLGCFEILSSDYPPNHPKAEFVQIAKREIVRVDGIVAEFLDFAQPPPATCRPVDLNDVADTVTRLVGPILTERGSMRIAPNLLSETLPVMVDANQMERAIVELVLAASSLAPRGSLTLSTDKRGTTAEIAVGIEPFDRRLPSDLFEPFAESSIANGLTLPVVRRFVENQGGTVRAETAGRRARFLIELPLSTAAATSPLTQPASPVAAEETRAWETRIATSRPRAATLRQA